MLRKTLLAACLAVAGVTFGTGTALADKLKEIKERGKIVVGIKNDYRPWGFLDTSGQVIGMEIDMAKDVAKRLGVEVELVPVIASNRMEFLQQGKIDLIIATMGDNPKRREVVGMIEPNYYAGGTNVLAPKSAGLKDWKDLEGKNVCAIQGAYYNKRVSQIYKPNLLAFAGIPEALTALESGNCVAFLYDNTWIESQLAGEARLADYEMPLVTEDLQPWAVAVPLEELNSPYGDLMREISVDWHKSGYLIEVNKKWGIKDSPFLQEMHAKYKGS